MSVSLPEQQVPKSTLAWNGSRLMGTDGGMDDAERTRLMS
jgi:hypothetical protein